MFTQIVNKIYNYFQTNTPIYIPIINNNVEEENCVSIYQKLLIKQSSLNVYLNMLEIKIEHNKKYNTIDNELINKYQEKYKEYLLLTEDILIHRRKLNEL
jgi:hypothetical protein